MKFKGTESQLMARLLTEFGDPQSLERGSIIRGTIVGRQRERDYLVDCRAKYDAVLPKEEVELADLKLGDRIDVFVVRPPDEDSPARVSARLARSWNAMINAFKSGTTVQIYLGRPVGPRTGNYAGFHAVCEELHGFVPGSKLGMNPSKAMDLAHQNQPFEAKVIEADPSTGKLVFDCLSVRREKAEKTRFAETLREQRFTSLKRGDVVDGTVVSVTDYGYFVNIGDDLHALLHKQEHDGTTLQVGSHVSARVIRCERTADGARRVAISTLAPVIERLKAGDKVSGVVRNIAAFGVFVRISRGNRVDGLVHKSEMPNGAQTLASLRPGDTVDVRILNVDRPADASISPCATSHNHNTTRVAAGAMRPRSQLTYYYTVAYPQIMDKN